MAEPDSPDLMIATCVKAWPSPWSEVWSYTCRDRGVVAWYPAQNCRASPATAVYIARRSDPHSDSLGCLFRADGHWRSIGRVRGTLLGIAYEERGGHLVERSRIDPGEPGISANERLVRTNFLAGEWPIDGVTESASRAVESTVLDAVRRLASGDGGSIERMQQRGAARLILQHLEDKDRLTDAVRCWAYWLATDAGLGPASRLRR